MELLRSRGVGFVEPGSGYLACGWLGKGRLAEVHDIVEAAMRAARAAQGSRGRDDRRHRRARRSRTSIPCASSRTARAGGWAIGWPRPRAIAARASSWCRDPRRCRNPPASSSSRCARRRRCTRPLWRALDAATVVAMAAAVSDYRPASVRNAEAQEGGRRPERSRWSEPRTSSRSLGAAKGSRFLVGFAAETENVLESARQKRLEKNVDLIVANDVSSRRGGVRRTRRTRPC